MSTSIGALSAGEPLAIIQTRYKSVRSSARGRLRARADGVGTLDLQFEARRRRGSRGTPSLINEWRAGPIRSCNLVFEALCHGLTLLGDEPSYDGALGLSRRIDRQLTNRLTHYMQLSEGSYDQLHSHVHFTAGTKPAGASLPVPLSWVAAGVVSTGQPERQTFLMVRRPKAWELWMRIERTGSGSMPVRRHTCLCSTGLLYEEPALAAELMLHTFLRQRGGIPVSLEESPSSLIAADRLRLIEKRLANPQ